MIVYRQWDEVRKMNHENVNVTIICDGWFLFGIIPLYIRRKFY